MIVRRERIADREASRVVQVAAFGDGVTEPVEARLLDELRVCDGWLPEFSWVADADGIVIGHVISTRGYVDDTTCLGLGPIGVLPGRQRDGVGSALMHATIGAADATGEPLIALLGDPGYYRRFGFVPSSDLGIAPPEPAWGEYFQVRPLARWSDSITGTFRYSDPFQNLE